MSTRGPSGGGQDPTAPEDSDDDDLDQDTAISNPDAARALLESIGPTAPDVPPAPRAPAAPPRRNTPPAIRATPVPQQPPQRPTPVPQQPQQRPTPMPQQPPQRPTPMPQQPQRPTPMPAPVRAQTEPGMSPPARAQTEPGLSPKGGRAMERTDIVPELRRDLQLVRAADGVQVTDMKTGATTLLNEYEISLARMLNGKRPVFEVLAAGEQIGIPVNVESLEKFITKLEMQGLLRPPESLDAAVENAWPTRGQWESSVRTLFQSGIRFMRQGKYAEAIGYFETLLAEDPDNIEANELLAMCKQAQVTPPQSMVIPAVGYPMGSAPMPASFDPSSSPQYPTPSQQYPQQYPTPSQHYPAQHAPPEHVPPHQQAYPGYPPAAMPLQIAQPGPPHAPRFSNRLLLAMVGVVLLGAVLGFALLRKGGSGKPVVAQTPRVNTEPAKTEPAKTEPAKTEPAKTEPANTEPANTEPAKTEPANTEPAKTEPAKTEPAKTEPAKTEPAKTEPAKTDPKKGTNAGPPTEIAAPSAGNVTAYLKGARAVRNGEKLFAITKVSGDPAKIKEATAKVAEMQKLAKEDPIYEEFLATAKKDLAKVRQVSTVVVTASKAGKATPKVKTGANVRDGQVLAIIQ